MHDFLKLHYSSDAYMGVQKERKSTFLTAFVSERLCHLKAQYPIQSPDICIGQQILRIDHPITIMEWLCFSYS